MVTANILNQIYAITSFDTSSSKITLINHMEKADRLKLCYQDFQMKIQSLFWQTEILLQHGNSPQVKQTSAR